MVVTYGHLKMAKYTRITFDAHQNTNMSFIKFFEKLELSPLFVFRNHSWVSFVGFPESYTEVVRNMPIKWISEATSRATTGCYKGKRYEPQTYKSICTSVYDFEPERINKF